MNFFIQAVYDSSKNPIKHYAYTSDNYVEQSRVKAFHFGDIASRFISLLGTTVEEVECKGNNIKYNVVSNGNIEYYLRTRLLDMPDSRDCINYRGYHIKINGSTVECTSNHNIIEFDVDDIDMHNEFNNEVHIDLAYLHNAVEVCKHIDKMLPMED